MNSIQSLMKEVAVFHSKKTGVALMLWLNAALVGCLLGELLFASVINLLLFVALVKYEKNLEKRASALDGGPIWNVQINGIKLGEISDAELADLRWRVYFDDGTYMKQMLNLISVVGRFVKSMMISLPVVTFWLAIAAYFMAPEILSQTITTLQTTKSSQYSVQGLIAFMMLYAMFQICMTSLLGIELGLVNHFEKDCAERVRRFIACPTEGRVSLYRIENEQHVTPNEIAGLRG